jgi:hypothetical protein
VIPIAAGFPQRRAFEESLSAAGAREEAGRRFMLRFFACVGFVGLILAIAFGVLWRASP